MSVEQTNGIRNIPVKIKRLHPDAVIPKYATELAAGFDLVAVEDVIIAPGETKLIPLGFAVEIPEGCEMQIRPRSGVSCNTKLRVANSPGTVDGDFRGEVKVIIDNIAQPQIDDREIEYWETNFVTQIDGNDVKYDWHTRLRGTYLVRKGDRIAQGLVTPVLRADFIEVGELSDTQRGDGGFGHTGTSSFGTAR
ncbi:dUTP diphosphatase [Paenibacillus sp. SC116]|uniref:dUTP diphosphatase n=1 Tax=Paenibacillus sp. SC116 TaxID=2968986 RepID=UPI00215AC9EC|nr:dUTP diphosphatase [Paenibacillus sp. SC116]MCR8843111.1 dUTP diphosphatase [Paenibacillus sp. SC116]